MCAQAEEWSPQRAAATSRLTRNRSRKTNPTLCGETRGDARSAGTCVSTVRTGSPPNDRTLFYSGFMSFVAFSSRRCSRDVDECDDTKDVTGNKKKTEGPKHPQIVFIPFWSFYLFFAAVDVHALRKGVCTVWRDTRLRITLSLKRRFDYCLLISLIGCVDLVVAGFFIFKRAKSKKTPRPPTPPHPLPSLSPWLHAPGTRTRAHSLMS